ncbi:MAG: guanylate kinase [Bacilli bacterium]|nr:guanylate kinase [Bacilli bacterium]
MKKGLLIILSGPSGVGKGTIRKKIIKNPDLNLAYSISMTTREKREKEIEGEDYYFVSRETFLENIKRGNFLEHCEFVGNFYGTPKDKIEKLRLQGKNVFLEIEVSGATEVMSKIDKDDYVSIFLTPPSMKTLESRIRKRRSESEEIIQKRLDKAKSELGAGVNYDYIVVNDVLKKAAKAITDIIIEKIKENNEK